VLPLPEDQIYVDFSILIAHNESYIRRCSITIVLCLMSVLKYLRHSQTYGTLAVRPVQLAVLCWLHARP
jgi:hypothetical protein